MYLFNFLVLELLGRVLASFKDRTHVLGGKHNTIYLHARSSCWKLFVFSNCKMDFAPFVGRLHRRLANMIYHCLVTALLESQLENSEAVFTNKKSDS